MRESAASVYRKIEVNCPTYACKSIVAEPESRVPGGNLSTKTDPARRRDPSPFLVLGQQLERQARR